MDFSDSMNYIEVDDRPNPYNISKRSLHTGICMYGARVYNFLFGRLLSGPALVERLEKVRALPIRADDIFVYAWPRSGTHWVYDICHMLLNGSARSPPCVKEFSMMEYADLDRLEGEPSPRIFNSHLAPEHLPQQMFERKTKIVHVVRNPKDALCSFYYMYTLLSGEGFTLDGFMEAFIKNDVLHIGNQFEFLHRISEFERENPNHPVLTIYYEDLKQDLVGVIKDIAKFLGTSFPEEFFQEVAAACSFEKMKEAETKKQCPAFLADLPIRDQMYRKGTIGDWKNVFTVAQNERMDKFISEETDKYSLKYKFRFV